MITLYRGSRGKGKTLTMVKDGLKFFQNGFLVYSNLKSLKFGLYVDSDFILNLSRNSDLRNCVLIIDEIELFFDSREYSKKQNKDFSKFLQQVRKRNVNILCTAQYISLVDIRIRQQIDVIAYPHFNSKTFYCKTYYFDLTKLEDDFRKIEQINIPACLVVYDGLKIFELYDTFEML